MHIYTIMGDLTHMGKFSRDKGKRNELKLVHSLRAEGFKAERVPLSGASAMIKHDVIFEEQNGTQHTIELKTRKCSFDFVYRIMAKFYPYSNNESAGGLFLALSDTDLVSLHYTASEAIAAKDSLHRYIEVQPLEDKKAARDLQRIINLKHLKEGADLLVIKDDHKAFIYINYR